MVFVQIKGIWHGISVNLYYSMVMDILNLYTCKQIMKNLIWPQIYDDMDVRIISIYIS